MDNIICPNADFFDPSELLELARTIVVRDLDQDLIEKVTLLQGYLDLSQMAPDPDYGPVLRRAIGEATAAVHAHVRPPDAAPDGKKTPETIK